MVGVASTPSNVAFARRRLTVSVVTTSESLGSYKSLTLTLLASNSKPTGHHNTIFVIVGRSMFMANRMKMIRVQRRIARGTLSLPLCLASFFWREIVMGIPFLTSNIFMTLNVAYARLAPHNPPWPPTYDLRASLITMQVNGSGLSSPTRGADFGIVSYDWSNMKQLWAQAKPMDCEERLVEQARATKAAMRQRNNNSHHSLNKHVFVYRNLVKALPWFTTIREKLLNPQYEGFFLKFHQNEDDSKQPYHVPPCAAENNTKCSHLYHDQLQTPQVPTPANPHPDGSCRDECDCGRDLPCGEYIYDHRNGTMLRQWLVQQVILGPTTIGLDGGGTIDGVFIDDFWCSNLLCEADPSIAGCPCNDPVQGPTETNPYAQVDMGLSDADIRDLTLAWNETMTVVERALLRHGAYVWSLMAGQHNANAQPFLLEKDTCAAALREGCRIDSTWQQSTRLFGFTIVNNTQLAQLDQDLAFFLLVRGPFAYAGWGVWGMTWPFNAEPAHGGLPPMPDGVPLPAKLQYDYGVPLEICHQVEPQVFERQWSRARVRLDCSTFEATIDMSWDDTVGSDVVVAH